MASSRRLTKVRLLSFILGVGAEWGTAAIALSVLFSPWSGSVKPDRCSALSVSLGTLTGTAGLAEGSTCRDRRGAQRVGLL